MHISINQIQRDFRGRPCLPLGCSIPKLFSRLFLNFYYVIYEWGQDRPSKREVYLLRCIHTKRKPAKHSIT